MLDRVLATLADRRDAAVAALKDFLAIPSVSTKPEHKPDMVRCATWLADQLKFGGLSAEVLPTTGHPVVLARSVWESIPDEGARALEPLLVPCDDLGSPGDVDFRR